MCMKIHRDSDVFERSLGISNTCVEGLVVCMKMLYLKTSY